MFIAKEIGHSSTKFKIISMSLANGKQRVMKSPILPTIFFLHIIYITILCVTLLWLGYKVVTWQTLPGLAEPCLSRIIEQPPAERTRPYRILETRRVKMIGQRRLVTLNLMYRVEGPTPHYCKARQDSKKCLIIFTPAQWDLFIYTGFYKV